MTRVYELNGLSCANCAAAIENEVASLPEVSGAFVNLVNESILVDYNEGFEEHELFETLVSIVKRYEPEVVVKPTADGPSSRVGEEDDPLEAHHRSNARNIKIRIAAAGFVLLLALLAPFPSPLRIAVFLTAYFIAGYDVILQALDNLRRGRLFDEFFLMSLATIGAIILGEYAEGIAVMLFWQVGELVHEYAVARSRRSIANLIDIRPEIARLVEGDTMREVPPDEVKVGEIIQVNPGELIPLDGVIVRGDSSLDTSALTGEALPRDVGPRDTVLSGSVNLNGVLQLSVTGPAGESTVAKILELVEHSSYKKAPVERFITKFARYYTPAVVGLAAFVGLALPLILRQDFGLWIHRALTFLVVSCPCALVVSVPIGYFGGIGAASARGILVKGGNYLEALCGVDTMVFDKTGTLTRGTFEVKEVRALPGVSEAELLELAALAEAHSNHPIALSIRKAYEAVYGESADNVGNRVAALEEVPGHGVRALIDGKTVLVGNERFLQREGLDFTAPRSTASLVHVASGGRALGSIYISDVLKNTSAKALRNLHKMGIKELALLTGDREDVADELRQQLPLDTVRAELLPQDKVTEYEAIRARNKGVTVFVGDGLNDAPVLALADLGIAMGGIGQDAAIEAADVVLMTDDLDRIPEALFIARKTQRIVWQNIIFALGVKILIMILAGFGYANMWAAVFGDVGVTVLAIFNSLRALRLANGERYKRYHRTSGGF